MSAAGFTELGVNSMQICLHVFPVASHRQIFPSQFNDQLLTFNKAEELAYPKSLSSDSVAQLYFV